MLLKHQGRIVLSNEHIAENYRQHVQERVYVLLSGHTAIQRRYICRAVQEFQEIYRRAIKFGIVRRFGNLERLAKNLAKATDADLFEIVPALAYTTEDLDWNDEQSRSTIEMKDSTARPEVASKVENMDQYTTIYVGFPIWWYTAPRIINTFLEQYDLTGKTIIPFATSGGSEIGKSGEDLKKASAPNANWILPGKVINGNPPVDSLKAWVETLK